MTEQMNVPKLRFSGFEGEWESHQLKSLSKTITKGTTPKRFNSGDINFVKIESLIGTKIDLNKCITIDSETHGGELKRSILQEGDILFAIAGATVGKVGVVDSAVLPANTNQALAIIRLKNAATLDFTVHVLLSRIMKKYIFQSVSVGAQPNLNLEQIGSFQFLAPALPEQQKIASFLSKVDEKITLLTEKKAKLTEYKKGAMQQLFDGSFQEQDGKLVFVPPTLRFKADDGSEFPDWDEKKLGDFYKNLSTGMTPSRKVSEYFKGDNLWITSGELNFGFVNDTKEKITAEAIKDTSLKIYPAGTFFIAITGLEAPGTRGRCAINAVPATTNQSCMAFERLELVDTNFLYFWYKNYSEAFYCKYAQGTKQQSFNNKLVEGIPINLPVKAEQTKIADFLSGIEQKIGLVNSELEKAKEWKKGLLQQMFV